MLEDLSDVLIMSQRSYGRKRKAPHSSPAKKSTTSAASSAPSSSAPAEQPVKAKAPKRKITKTGATGAKDKTGDKAGTSK